MTDTKAINLFAEIGECIADMTAEDRGSLLSAIVLYATSRTIPEDLTYGAKIAFGLLKYRIDKEDAISDMRRKNGAKGAESKWQTDGNGMANHGKGMANDGKGMANDGKSLEKKEETEKGEESEKTKEKDEKKEEKVKKSKEIEKNKRDSLCTEPETDSMPPEITLPLNDGTEYGVTEAQVLEWSDLYPAVDVRQELRNMRGWCMDNRTKRKTKSGITRFIGNWLRKAQDRGGVRASPVGGSSFMDLYRSEFGGG